VRSFRAVAFNKASNCSPVPHGLRNDFSKKSGVRQAAFLIFPDNSAFVALVLVIEPIRNEFRNRNGSAHVPRASSGVAPELSSTMLAGIAATEKFVGRGFRRDAENHTPEAHAPRNPRLHPLSISEFGSDLDAQVGFHPIPADFLENYPEAMKSQNKSCQLTRGNSPAPYQNG
jgi:hypothetical protein